MHLSSAWSAFVSWWCECKQLRKQLREAKATCRALRRQCQTGQEFNASVTKEHEWATEKIKELKHLVELRDSQVEVLKSEVELLGQVIERDMQRVKTETAQHTYQRTRLLDAGIEGADLEE